MSRKLYVLANIQVIMCEMAVCFVCAQCSKRLKKFLLRGLLCGKEPYIFFLFERILRAVLREQLRQFWRTPILLICEAQLLAFNRCPQMQKSCLTKITKSWPYILGRYIILQNWNSHPICFLLMASHLMLIW